MLERHGELGWDGLQVIANGQASGHSYGSAHKDYLFLGQFGRFCMFRDINDSMLQHYVEGETARRLWKTHPETHRAFLVHTRNASMMGIGLLSGGRH